MSKRLFSLSTDKPWELSDIKLVHVSGCDGNKFVIPKTLGYFREPSEDELPFDLSQGYMRYRKAEPDFYNELHYFSFIMESEPKMDVGQGFDFCTNRGTLVKMLIGPVELIATKYKGSIYLKALTVDDYEMSNVKQKQYTYLFKLRHHLIVDQLGDKPNVNRFVNRSVQNYGTFTAKLGKLRLLYTAEINGLDNNEPIGDLTDPDVLKQCCFTMMRVVPMNATNWRQNYRMKRWLLQSHFNGSKQMRVAFCNFHGVVATPILTESCNSLLKEQEWCLSGCMLQLHHFLSKISEAMAGVDCPDTCYVFKTVDGVVYYDCLVGKNKHSFLTEAFINFVN